MRSSVKIVLLLSLLCMGLVFTGCSTEDSNENYGEAYDVDYMTTDYVDQLIRDGAETVVGSVEITGSEDDYTVNVTEKKVVPNENYEDGYYVADKNMTSTYPLGSDMGILAMDGNEVTACTAEEFIKDHSGDAESLYTVYLIGDVVELIQPLDPKTVTDNQ